MIIRQLFHVKMHLKIIKPSFKSTGQFQKPKLICQKAKIRCALNGYTEFLVVIIEFYFDT